MNCNASGRTRTLRCCNGREYRSVVDDKVRRLPAAVAAVHLFNHGTHHRGQLTTLMKQAGVDPGVTDLPWLPGIVRIID